jgi:hypothetical protein
MGPAAGFEPATFSFEARRLKLLRVAQGPLTDLLAHGPVVAPHVAAGAAPTSTESSRCLNYRRRFSAVLELAGT